MSSWVKVSRKLLTSAIGSKPEYLAVWVHLLLTASYKAGEVLVGHQVVRLEPGDLVFGRVKFSQQIGVSEHTLRMALKTLEKLQQITIKSHSKFSVISITNWTKYQLDSPANHQQPTSNPPATHHNKEVQELQDKSFKAPPTPQGGKRKPKAKVEEAKFDLPDWIDPDAWEGFVGMRKAIKKPMTHRAMELAVAKLVKLDALGYAAADVLNQSTLNSWQGLLEVKDYERKNFGSKPSGEGASAGKPSLSEQVRAHNAARETHGHGAAGYGFEDSAELRETGMGGPGCFDGEFDRINPSNGQLVGAYD